MDPGDKQVLVRLYHKLGELICTKAVPASALAGSGWCQRKLSSQPDHIDMFVWGSQPTGRALLDYLSSHELPKPTTQSESQLLHMADMAIHYNMPKLVDDVLQYLLVALQGRPQWATLLWLAGDFPEGGDVVAARPHPARPSVFFDPCYNLACAKMLQLLGNDLEAIMQCSKGCKRLASLPVNVLLRLLDSADTRVYCESTVVAAIRYWVAAHPRNSLTRAQALRLARCVRMLGLPVEYLQSMLQHMAWLVEALGREGVQEVSLFRDVARRCSYGVRWQHYHKDISSSLQERFGGAPEQLETVSMMLRDVRQPSAVQHLHLAAAIPLEQLRQVYVTGQGSGEDSSSCAWQGTSFKHFAGLDWQLLWRFSKPQPGSRLQGKLGIQLQVGVCYSVFGIPRDAVVVMPLIRPSLHHPKATAGHMLQGQQQGQCKQIVQVAMMAVLECNEVLPLRLQGGETESAWQRKVKPFLDGSGQLQLEVVSDDIMRYAVLQGFASTR